eukprot:953959-Amphidinium_carterae.1
MLGCPGVVMTLPSDTLKKTVLFNGQKLSAAVAKATNKHPRLEMRHVEQHLSQGFDEVSNLVRTTRQPMCYPE